MNFIHPDSLRSHVTDRQTQIRDEVTRDRLAAQARAGRRVVPDRPSGRRLPALTRLPAGLWRAPAGSRG
jgi:hypothetical protein